MNIKSLLLASTAILALSTGAYAANKETYDSQVKIERDAAGNYSEKATLSKTDLDGTTTTTKKKLTVDVDSKGNIDKTRTVENVTDPKGLGNKHVVMVKDTEKTKDGEVTVTHEKKVDGKNAEGTTDHYKATSKVSKDADGNYAEKDITTRTDADGTIISFEKKANVDVDSNGNIDKSTTVTHSSDPAGLMNKTSTKTADTEKSKSDGSLETTHKVSVDGKTTESTTSTTTN